MSKAFAGKQHNGSFGAKQLLRRQIREQAGEGARVLEGFAGEGRMYRGCWHGLRGACIDIAEAKASAAARERPHWACYRADTEKALAAGLGSLQRWDVVDLDAYGSPWKFLRAYLTSRRLFAPVTHIVLTDGYMVQRNSTNPCQALFPAMKGQAEESSGGKRLTRMNIERDEYLEIAAARVQGWAPHPIQWAGTVLHTRKGNGGHQFMALHHLVMSAPEEPASGVQKGSEPLRSAGDGPRQTSGIA